MNDSIDTALIAAIQDGLPLCPHPYASIARQLGVEEQQVIERIRTLLGDGTIKRLGVVVRHRALGYRANAMVVWDIPDREVDGIGDEMAKVDSVTLCYRRPRCLPQWPYNLFCMIHGRDRESVGACVGRIASELGLQDVSRAVLFSKREFKQRGARYVRSPLPENKPESRLNAVD